MALISQHILTKFFFSLSFQIKYTLESYGSQTVVKYVPFNIFDESHVVSDFSELLLDYFVRAVLVAYSV